MPQAKDPIRIRNAADLFAGLRHPELAVRLPTLAAVAGQPDLVLAYGPYQGVDVIQELISQLLEDSGLFGPVILGALTCFQGERVLATCSQIARESDEREMIDLAVARLAREEAISARQTLADLIWCEQPQRAQRAARSLSARSDLTRAEKIRIDLWIGRPDPSLTEPESRAVWLQELGGPLQLQTRRCLEQQGLQAFQWLSEQPPSALVPWLVQWGSSLFPQQALPLLESALQGEHANLALRQIAASPEKYPSLCAQLERFLDSPDPIQRTLAWRLNPPQNRAGWSAALCAENHPEVRLAMAEARVRHQPRCDELLLLAHDSDWRIRSLASQGLIARKSLDVGRQLALSEAVEQKAVGAATLVALEDYEWMEENLLA